MLALNQIFVTGSKGPLLRTVCVQYLVTMISSSESQRGALNHRLELIFGSRSTSSIIKFKGKGRSLEAIVYIFKKYIDGEDMVMIRQHYKREEALTSSVCTLTLHQNYLVSPIVIHRCLTHYGRQSALLISCPRHTFFHRITHWWKAKA